MDFQKLLVSQLESHRGVIVLGETICGKSSLIKRLESKEAKLKVYDAPDFTVRSLAPLSYSIEELYYAGRQNGIIQNIIE